jgi:hypothetical protein
MMMMMEGRSDLETLLGSPDAGDWVKLSEMLLGPVPVCYVMLWFPFYTPISAVSSWVCKHPVTALYDIRH